MGNLVVGGVGLVLADDLPLALLAVVARQRHPHAEAHDIRLGVGHRHFGGLAARHPVAQVAQCQRRLLGIALALRIGQIVLEDGDLGLNHGQAGRCHEVAERADRPLAQCAGRNRVVLFAYETLAHAISSKCGL